MDEAKTLINMSVSTMLASLFLFAAIGLIGIGYLMWSFFSKQDLANSRMADYANYAAFDNTTVRGQEVIGLLEGEPDIFIAIVNSTSPNGETVETHIDNTAVSSNVNALYYTDSAYIKDFNFTSLTNTTNSLPVCSSALNRIKSTSGTPGTYLAAHPACLDLSAMSHSELVETFTDPNKLGRRYVDVAGNPDTENKYSAFKSILIYDETQGTNDIIGVVFVRPCGNVVY